MRKNLLIILISIIIIVAIVLIVLYTKKNNESNTSAGESNSNSKVEINFDENTSLYYVRDEKTGDIISASQDEADLDFYKENPDYNPNPLQTKTNNIEDYVSSPSEATEE